MDIPKMTDSELLDTIWFLRRNAEQILVAGEIIGWSIDDFLFDTQPLWPWLMEEMKKRGLDAGDVH